jgi:aminopeptidase N
MIADELGEEKFRKGLNIYLNRHKYSNAVTEDLWKGLEEGSGFQVNTFMDAFTKTTGYPLVSIESTDKVTTRVHSYP